MIKSKRLVISVVAIISVLLVGLGVFFGVRANLEGKITFTVDDTLPDGEGRVAHVILLGGQSNASGCASDEYLKRNVGEEKYSEYDNGYDNVYINYYVTDNNISGGFVRAKTRQGELGGFFGSELGLAEGLHAEHPDEAFFIIKCAWGGSNLFKQWLSPSGFGKTGEMYKKFVAFVDASVEYLASKGYDVKIEGMCWMQGESDSFSTNHAKDYEANLKSLIKDLRKRYKKYASDDGIIFVDAYIADLPIFWVYGSLVNESKRAVAASDPKNLLIDTIAHGLDTTKEPTDNPDVPHYDSMSQIKLGNLFAAELLGYLD